MTTPVKIPNRASYKAADVCAIAELQPYVLRTWEAEFPNLGVAPENGRARVYRRSDIDTVLRIKELIVVEGLTLGAARRKLIKESPAEESEPLPFDEDDGEETRQRIEQVKAGLRALLESLSGPSKGGAVASPRVVAVGGEVAPQAAAAAPSTADADDTRQPSRRANQARKRA